MPILIPLVLSWLSGLFVAALAAPDVLLVDGSAGTSPVLAGCMALLPALLLALLVLLVLSRREGRPPMDASRFTAPTACLAMSLAGLLVGAAHARAQSLCIALLARQPAVLMAIDERVGVGGRVMGAARIVPGALRRAGDATAHAAMIPHRATTSARRSLVDTPQAIAGCVVPASLRVRSGHATPGAIVVARGNIRRTARGVRVDGDIVETGQSERLRAWRGHTGETIDSLFGANAALVRALLIADQDGISADVRDRFADAGLVHMLSISGLHVAIIAGSLLTVASAFRMSRDVANAAALLVIAVYVLMLGAPAPAIRSAVMLATISLGERLQRPTHPWTALALGASLPTVNPGVVLDVGYQLSVAGMASLVAARALMRRVRHGEVSRRRPNELWTARARRALHRHIRALHGWRWNLMRECCTGVIATCVTAPLIAWTFGRVSVIAPLSNLVAGPVVAFAQPALFLALVLAPWRAGARFVADATGPPLALLDWIARLAASIPHASIHIAPTLLGAVCAGVAAAAFVRATAARRMWPGIVTASGALTIAVWAPVLGRGEGTLEMHMIDVGQGDAVGLRTPHGEWVIVDAGRIWEGGDAGRRSVIPYVQRRGGHVAAFVMSHAHDDHVGGAASVIAALAPLSWWEPAFVTTSSAYRAALVAVGVVGARWHRAEPDDRFTVDGVTFTILAPDSAWTAAQTDANETSVVLRVDYGRVRFLLTGDAEQSEEAWLVAHHSPEALRADVLKVGHHGSRTSSSAAFLDAVRPSLALISVGEDNRYGHPSPESLLAFAERRVTVLRTDRDGSIVASTDGTHLSVLAHGERFEITTPR